MEFIKGNIKLINADCMQVMKDYPDNYFDYAVVDPEYGGNDAIGLNDCKNLNKQATNRKQYRVFKNIAPKAEYFTELKRISKHQIIWGVNFYNNFDLSGGRIVWDKKGTAFGRAEMAYHSKTKSVDIIEFIWNGMLQQNMKNKETRIHVTQKPVGLYDRIWDKINALKEWKIFDSHGGSFSSAISAFYFGFSEFVGCEIDPNNFNDSVKRFKEQTMQQKLF